MRSLSVLWYWLLSFKLAGDEVLGIRNDASIDEARRLHRRLYG